MKIEDRKSGAVIQGSFSIPCFKKGGDSNFRHLFARKYMIRSDMRSDIELECALLLEVCCEKFVEIFYYCENLL